MNAKTLLLLLACFTSLSAFAQLTIEACYERARLNYPAIRQFELIQQSEQYNLTNASMGYLPQITLSGKASYQSEVTEIPIAMAGVEGMSKDQYGATLEVTQTLWDGGVTHARRKGVRSSSQVDSQNLEVELYALRDRINQIYFSLLLYAAQLEQNELYLNELQLTYNQVAASVANGVANQSDLDAVRIEQLKSIQSKSKLTHARSSYLAMLSALIGEKVLQDIALVQPLPTEEPSLANHRPELALYAAQIESYHTQSQSITAKMMPQLSAFVTGGYSRPGLNMLNNQFSPYYTAGLRLSWNISALYTTKSDRRLIQNNIQQIETQQQTFLFNADIDSQAKQQGVAQCRDQLIYDDEIIELKGAVKRSSQKKLENGTLSGVDLMRDVTAEQLAKQDKIVHQIELLQAIYDLKYSTNNF